MLTEKKLIKLLKTFKAKQDERDTAKDAVEALGTQIKGELALRGTNELKVGQFSVVLSKDIERPVVQGKALEADLPDVYKQYTKITLYDRLTVTE